MTISEQVVKAMPDRIYAVKRTEGSNCVVSFDTPSLDYNVEYIRADLVPFLPVQGAQLSPKDRNNAEVGGLVDTLRSMSHDDNTRACVSVNVTVGNDLAKKLFDVLHAAQKAATALEAQEAELAAVHQRYVDADESLIEAEAALAEARKALEQAEQQLDYGQVNAAHRILIRALSSPDHADAGKVEGDGWLPIETAPKDGTEFIGWDGKWAFRCSAGKQYVLYPHMDGGPTYRDVWDGHYYDSLTIERPTHWRPLPSAPSQEVA